MIEFIYTLSGSKSIPILVSDGGSSSLEKFI